MIPQRLEFLVSPELPPAQLAPRFSDAGHQLFLVGGSVRDAFLERPHDDFDFATDARPDRIAEILGGWADAVYTVGAAFGTIAAVKDGKTVEVTTFRDEIYRDDSRKPRVTFSDRIEDDLARRDFTVNAIALPLMEMVPVDPFGGLADLAAKRLRTPSILRCRSRMIRCECSGCFDFRLHWDSILTRKRSTQSHRWAIASRSCRQSGSATSFRSC